MHIAAGWPGRLQEGWPDALSRRAATTETLACRRERRRGSGGVVRLPLLLQKAWSLLTVKDLSAWLNMKPSTLYLWAGQGKVPCRKIHGLIRFDQEEIHQWLASFTPARGRDLSLSSPPQPQSEVERLIAAAKRDVYTRPRETRPREKKGATPNGSV